jgi:hypothetical protein
MSDILQRLLDEQSALQQTIEDKGGETHPLTLYVNATQLNSGGLYDHEPTENDRQALINFMQWNDKALLHEMVEMESETGWKPWAKGRFVNLEAARGEWIDMLHFILNGALLLGLDNANEILERYMRKHEKNTKRQEEGYDGVSTKCAGCGRAIDDEAVNCFISNETEVRTAFWCEKFEDYAFRVKPGAIA